MIQTLYNKHPHSTIAIVGSGPSALKYSHAEDIGIALNGALNLDADFDYFQGFDIGICARDYFYKNTKPTRIIGVGLAPMDKILYPDATTRSVVRGHTIRETSLGLPTPPHLYFRYEKKTTPNFNRHLQILSAAGNIVVCSIETALIMGADEIHLYGIDLSRRMYFYENVPHGSYIARVSDYVNDQLSMCEDNGVVIKVCRSKDSAIKIGADI
jgi:hypothetical protein